jgi:hypothetical protein
VSGNYDTFTNDGTVSLTDTKGTASFTGFPWFAQGGYRYVTQFVTGKFFEVCRAEGGWYLVKAYRWAGGANWSNLSSYPRATWCTFYRKGTSQNITWSSAFQFSDGFSVLGFNASSQTGYDKSASASFKFFSRANLCGTRDYPGGSPKILEVEPS